MNGAWRVEVGRLAQGLILIKRGVGLLRREGCRLLLHASGKSLPQH